MQRAKRQNPVEEVAIFSTTFSSNNICNAWRKKMRLWNKDTFSAAITLQNSIVASSLLNSLFYAGVLAVCATWHCLIEESSLIEFFFLQYKKTTCRNKFNFLCALWHRCSRWFHFASQLYWALPRTIPLNDGGWQHDPFQVVHCSYINQRHTPSNQTNRPHFLQYSHRTRTN